MTAFPEGHLHTARPRSVCSAVWMILMHYCTTRFSGLLYSVAADPAAVNYVRNDHTLATPCPGNVKLTSSLSVSTIALRLKTSTYAGVSAIRIAINTYHLTYERGSETRETPAGIWRNKSKYNGSFPVALYDVSVGGKTGTKLTSDAFFPRNQLPTRHRGWSALQHDTPRYFR